MLYTHCQSEQRISCNTDNSYDTVFVLDILNLRFGTSLFDTHGNMSMDHPKILENTEKLPLLWHKHVYPIPSPSTGQGDIFESYCIFKEQKYPFTVIENWIFSKSFCF